MSFPYNLSPEFSLFRIFFITFFLKNTLVICPLKSFGFSVKEKPLQLCFSRQLDKCCTYVHNT